MEIIITSFITELTQYTCLVALVLAVILLIWKFHFQGAQPTQNNLALPRNTPAKSLSVNYHFTRVCNYKCKFCFHTAKSSHVAEECEVRCAMRKLKNAGMEKLNISGGEPFLYPEFTANLVKHCKKTLNIPWVTIVSNGSKLKEEWMKKNGKYVDMLAISVDSFNPGTLHEIGRADPAMRTEAAHLDHLKDIRDWCEKYQVQFKINTVVNSQNFDEDMTKKIRELAPKRWKCFQCLLIDGENGSENDLRDARGMVVTDDQWKSFVERHEHLECFVPESNDVMRNSYLILDEKLRFLNNTAGNKQPGMCIIDEGVDMQTALQEAGFDEESFIQRNGDFFQSEQPLQSQSKRARNFVRNFLEW